MASIYFRLGAAALGVSGLPPAVAATAAVVIVGTLAAAARSRIFVNEPAPTLSSRGSVRVLTSKGELTFEEKNRLVKMRNARNKESDRRYGEMSAAELELEWNQRDDLDGETVSILRKAIRERKGIEGPYRHSVQSCPSCLETGENCKCRTLGPYRGESQ